MKIVMTLLVRDEADIVAANIDYHLAQGVSFIIATDNRSVDGTPRILKSYETKGVLKYIYEPADDYSQGVWVTRMARMACVDYGADWVINNDADEFWWPETGNLCSAFATVPADTHVLRARRHNFIAVPGQGPFFRRMIYREAASFNLFGLPLPPKVAHRGHPGVRVAQGNHDVEGFPSSPICDGPVAIFHFPVRTYDQILNKIANGGAAYERNTNLPMLTGLTWRKLYDEFKTNLNVRSHYEANCPDADSRARKLLSGEIIEDGRLADFLATRLRRDDHGRNLG